MTTRIAHISDLHFGAEDGAVVEALVADLNAGEHDLIAISGDLTMGARRSEFRAARAFMDRLRAPVLAVPGNHDLTPYKLWERLVDPYGRWHAVISIETEPSWRNDQVAVVGLNTARRIGLHWDWSRGRVTGRRLRRLLSRFAAYPDGLVRIVVAHHPLLPPETAPETPVAGGAAQALAAFARAGITLVLAGHLHRGYARLAAAGSRAPLILQGSTATSIRLRGEPNAYNRVTIADDGQALLEVRVWNGQAWQRQAATTAAPRTGDPAEAEAPHVEVPIPTVGETHH
jgi:3',5'-cyclic AMP phosphodiesterase CpdA